MSKSIPQTKPKVTPNLEKSLLIRALDLFVAGSGLLLLGPVFLLIALAIKFTSAGPIFYRSKRVGQGGQLFNLYKYRTKYPDSLEQRAKPQTGDSLDLTPVGRFLHRTNLAGLPQLINILRGEMSLVGPPPLDPRQMAPFTPMQRQLLTVRPGLISPASFHNLEATPPAAGETYQEQALPLRQALELAYLKQRTLWTDLGVILRAILHPITEREYSYPIPQLRNRHFFLLDIFVLYFTPALALSLRLDGLGWWPKSGPALFLFTGVALLVKLPIFYRLGLYRCYWRYAGVNELSRVLMAVGFSTTILTFLFMALHAPLLSYGLAMYRAVPLIDGLLTGLVIGGTRVGIRALYHWDRQHQAVAGGRRVLVVGAGEGGTLVVREMRANPQLNMEPVAFVDDDPAKIGQQIQGLPVLGGCKDIPALAELYRIQRIVVAFPSAPFQRQQEILEWCKKTGIITYKLPGIYELLAGHKTISESPKIDINRLLRRSPVQIDQMEVANAMAGATLLVTGAGGSIGRELCRQLARFEPREIILLGHGENSIFEIDLDLRLSFPELTTSPVIVDVRDQRRVNQVVARHRPDVIFHAAAHKHVPFMQNNVEEAITNNIVGTRNVLQAAEQHGVERFVLISTDKAVNPTSIMGATKRLAEFLVLAAARRSKRAYMAVRFGNVLGSRGSVIPVFQQQIAAGGPLTVTHPEMSRYFMTIPEAVQLVLQASVLGQGSEVFVLDMGQPVRILDLAVDLIKLSGLEPDRDIKIVFTGPRPGEKLAEELFLKDEGNQRTKHQRIFVTAPGNLNQAAAIEQVVTALIDLTDRVQGRASAERLQTILLEICYYIDKFQSEPQPALLKQPAKPGLISPSASFNIRPASSNA